MKKISESHLSRIRKDGANIKMKKKAQRKGVDKPVVQAAPAPPPVTQAPPDMTKVVASIDLAASKIAASSEANNKAILALQKKLIEAGSKKVIPHSYKFTIHRDSYGYIETVDAVPGG